MSYQCVDNYYYEDGDTIKYLTCNLQPDNLTAVWDPAILECVCKYQYDMVWEPAILNTQIVMSSVNLINYLVKIHLKLMWPLDQIIITYSNIPLEIYMKRQLILFGRKI